MLVRRPSILAAASILMVLASSWAPSAHALGPGDAAPDFTLNDVNGTPYTLSDYRGEVVMLALIGHGCPFCRNAGPAVEQVNHDYTNTWPFQAIAVDCWNGSNFSVQAYIDITGYTFPVLTQGQTIQSLYGIFYDNYIVIDADGIIRYTSVNEIHQMDVGRFHDAHLRAAITGEVTAAGDPSFETRLRVTSPVRAGEVATFRLGLPAAAGTRLELFDARGRRLREIPTPAATWQVLPWRATDRGNEPLGSGVYFVRLHTAVGGRSTAKFVVVPR